MNRLIKNMHLQKTRYPFLKRSQRRNVSDELHIQHAVNFTKDNTIDAMNTAADIHIDTLLKLD